MAVSCCFQQTKVQALAGVRHCNLRRVALGRTGISGGGSGSGSSLNKSQIQTASSSALSSLVSSEDYPPTQCQPSRRDVLKKPFRIGAAATIATGTFIAASTIRARPANALELCRPKARNCIRTTWIPPPPSSSSNRNNLEDVKAEIRDALNSYPQKGQAGIDCNGWEIVEDITATDNNNSLIGLEYKSCIGPGAVAINLAQPFIDDVKFELIFDNATTTVTSVQVKSSSRMGSSDLFVNKKRVEYLGSYLKERGWTIPDVKYGSSSK